MDVVGQLFTREGARIAYQFTGTGSPIGYARGIPLSRAAVRRLGLFDFESLATGRRLLAYDAHGHGRSTGRPVVEDYRFDLDGSHHRLPRQLTGYPSSW